MAELPVDQLTGSKKMMLAALLQRMNQPNPSLGGNIGNALAMGLMGLYEGQDEKTALEIARGNADAAAAGVPGLSKAPAPAPAAPVPAAPAPAPAAPAPTSSVAPPKALASALSPELEDKITQVASTIGVNPAAVKSVIGVESNFNPQARTGSYSGLTQIGPQTFAEAPGGRLGGMSYDEYKTAPATRQLDAYPAYLDQYRFKDQMARNGIDVSKMPPEQQFAVLQGMQFAPNAQGWKQALAQGNLDVPTTPTRQATALGDTSINAMAGSRYGQQAAAQPVQMAQAPQPQTLQPPVQQYQLLQQAEQKALELGNRNLATHYATQRKALVDQYQADLKKLEIERLGKLQPSFGDTQAGVAVDAQKKANPTYSDLHPDVEIKEASDGSGRMDVYSKKTGQRLGSVPPSQGASGGIVLPNGTIASPPPGLTGQALKQWRDQVSGDVAKAQTGNQSETQSNAAAWASRMRASEPILQKFSGSVNNWKDQLLDKNAQFGIGGNANRGLMTPEYQQYTAARGAFLTGILRKESGATIQPNEFSLYDGIYFPQPGEDQQTIALKAEMRRIAVEQMEKTAGAGYQKPNAPAAPQNEAPENTIITAPTGQRLIKKQGKWTPYQ